MTAVVEVAGESRRRGSARGSARGGARLLSSLWGSNRTLGRQTDPAPTVTDSSVTSSSVSVRGQKMLTAGSRYEVRSF